jgi:hypothetical protein
VVSIRGLRQNTGVSSLWKFVENGEYFESIKFPTDVLHRSWNSLAWRSSSWRIAFKPLISRKITKYPIAIQPAS